MGVSVSVPCDTTLKSPCWVSINQSAKHITKLKENLEALDLSLRQLTALKNDVLRKVEVAELQRSMKRWNRVHQWIQDVQTIETQVAEVKNGGAQEVQKLCCGGYCSKNYLSSYKYGKKVAKKLAEVEALKSNGVFEEIAEESIPSALVHERPVEPTVGMESMLDEVWSRMQDEHVGIIGLYGMGGVGKTSLLTQMNNRLLPTDFDLVIWIVVSKEHKLEIIQDKIGAKIGISRDTWKQKEQHEKAEDISRLLSAKKFVLLFDDIWEPIEITKLGIPVPNARNKSKIIFTTRSEEVCGHMDAQKKIKLECLTWEKAWNLFQQKVGRETPLSHPDIHERAQTVAKECGGLPLALITVGRAMSCKKTPQEWNHAIHVLKNSASEFTGMKDKVFRLLKFSYDSLADDRVKSCLLYCAIFPEDYIMVKDELLDFWMCEAMLDEYSNVDQAKNKCYDIIGTLAAACLLEVHNNQVKMHDLIHDVRLKYLNLERTHHLDRVPPDLISSFLKLEVLRMLWCGSEGILFGGERALIEEIKGLKHLQVLSLSVRSSSCFEKLFCYHILLTCSLSLHLSIGNNYSNVHDISSLADMKHLNELHISDYPNLKELEIYWAGRTPNDPRNTMMTNHSRFCGLEYVTVWRCPNLKDLTLLIFAPNLSRLIIYGCPEIEKIIDLEGLGGVADVVKEQNPFGKLTVLSLSSLPLLKSIYDNALPFPHLTEIKAYRCPALKKLPLNSASVNAKRSSLIIEGREEWWNGLEWEDEVARNVFRPCFRLNPF